MEGLQRTQLDSSIQIRKLLDNFKKSPKDRVTKAFLETRLEMLSDYWEEFQKRHTSLTTISADERKSLKYFIENIYDTTLEIYLDFKTRIKERLHEIESKVQTASQAQVNSDESTSVVAKLPPIQLPKFSGDYREWLYFRDLFLSLVHDNKQINKVNKCQYLKSSLFGEAENLVKQIQVSEINYDIMWETLNKRYDNRRSIVNAFIGKLLNQRKINTESAKAIKDLLDVTSECLITLKSLDIPTDSWDDIVVYIIIQKLDPESHKLFEQKIESYSKLPTWKDMSEFLECRFRTLEAIKSRDHTQHKIMPITKSFATNISSHSPCPYCKQDHIIYKCKDFIQLNVNSRQEFVQKNHLCFNCLVKGHSVKTCKQSTSCRKCGRRHHSLLHGYSIAPSTANNMQPTQMTNDVTILGNSIDSCPVVLATAMVSVQSQRDNSIYTLRTLIDPGSQASLVTESVCQNLGLKRTPIIGNIVGVDSNRTVTKAFVEFEIASVQNPRFKVKIMAYVLKSLTSYLPQHEHKIVWPQLNSLQLADPSFQRPGKIDLILGADVYPDILQQGILIHKNDNSTLVAQQSRLGWLISGKSTNSCNRTHNHIHNYHLKTELDTELRRFWELEEPVYGKRAITNQEMQCEAYYESTYIKKADGHYQVRLPFITQPPNLGESLAAAMNSFTRLEKRFAKQPKLKEKYSEFMTDYLDQQHMELVQHNDNSENVYYLPHHAVINDQHTTTKLRVVFNGSAKTTNGKSLNDNLLVGPPLQNDLRDVTLRWRCHAVVFVGDIRQMYRQIWIDKRDQNYQRILWRPNPEDPIHHYRLTTVTYGTSCAPYLAIKTLRQLAHDEINNFRSEVTNAILNDFYVDDLLTGANDIDTTIALKEDITKVLAKGGFMLHKWISNHPKIESTTQQTRQILGIDYNSITDKFELKIDIKHKGDKITKRSVLCDIAQIYDPAGWLAPIVVRAKNMLQQLWENKIDWDDVVPEPLYEEWIKFRQELKDMPMIELDRWIGVSDKIVSIELHGFSDASDIAYSAVIYSRVVTTTNIKITMIESKTRVAPVKKISTPRLELCGAVLLAKLMHRVKATLNVKSDNVFAWTDATIVLAWLQKPPGYWSTFVANRVTEIVNVIEKEKWNHVASHENPADVASRGIAPSELPTHLLWWNGPSWLYSDNFPSQEINIPVTDLEIRLPLNVSVHNSLIDNSFDVFDKYSSLQKLVRIIAYCFKFFYKCQFKIKKVTKFEHCNFNYLTTAELQNSLYALLRISQDRNFSNELKILKSKNTLIKSSTSLKKGNKLAKLNPFVNKDNLLKVGGRLQNSDLADSTKHPIILDKDCKLSYLIVLDAHYKTLHGGFQLMINYIRSKYYIFSVKNLIKNVIHKCVSCCRHSARLASQLMGSLPKERVTQQRPFSVSGVDFAGPVILKLFSGRGSNRVQKSYIAVFVCTAVKAVHLELVTSLTSEGFIAAFRRFVSRRGHCKKLISDCGTNFIGANKELKRMFENSLINLSPEIEELLAKDGTEWKFNPPGAPHMGGLWESAVKSVKFHLQRVLNESKLTYEEYLTLLCQIESCLNSRPLTTINNDNEFIALTPGHFLIGEPPITIPDEHLNENIVYSYNSRWIYLQQKLQSFWRKWSQEYLTELQNRYKWTSIQTNIGVDKVVLIKDERLPPSKWLLGRVVETHPGADGNVRVVSVKCKTHIVKRPIHKLCILPTEDC